MFTAVEGAVQVPEDGGDVLHQHATLHRRFQMGNHVVNLPTVVKFEDSGRRSQHVLVVAVVRHHKQRRNELWAFRCNLQGLPVTVKVNNDAKRVLLSTRALLGFYAPCPQSATEEALRELQEGGTSAP